MLFHKHFNFCFKYPKWKSLRILSNGLNTSTGWCILMWMPIWNDKDTPAVIIAVRWVRQSYALMASCSVGLVHWSARNRLNSLVDVTDSLLQSTRTLDAFDLAHNTIWMHAPSCFQIVTVKLTNYEWHTLF